MNRLRSHRQLVNWIATLAVLWASLSPLIAHAMSPGGGSWVEVCSASGIKWVRADSGPDDSGTDAPVGAHPLVHCPCCMHHVPAPALPSHAAAVVLRADLAHAVPAAFLSSPRTPHAWLTARSRAPPTVA